MLGKIVLALWTTCGVVWWIISWWLARAGRGKKPAPATVPARRSISIFKPLPPLGVGGLEVLARGIESFVAQLDPASEVLLGVHEADRATIAPFVAKLEEKYPKALVRIFFRAEPDAVPNPKIAWQKHLAPHANGELWLWSDADIVAPPGFLPFAREEFARCGAAMLTFPYVVRRAERPGAFFEALFVNAEFYPGVRLLRRLGPVDFGLGAGMLFEREDFLNRVNWAELGSFLADDFQLGQMLRPVCIASQMLETVPSGRTWPEALRHDLRWAKTIRWNRPLGYFSRLAVLPVAGWLAAVATHPLHVFAWLGLLGMIQADVMAAGAICREIGCRVRGRDVVTMECWSLWRIAVWFLCWLPVPVDWAGRRWHEPQAGLIKSAETVLLQKPLTFHD